MPQTGRGLKPTKAYCPTNVQFSKPDAYGETQNCLQIIYVNAYKIQGVKRQKTTITQTSLCQFI